MTQQRAGSSEDRRFPARVYRAGSEPDARFSLANERTYLAWIRTALALVAGGVALKALDLGIHPGFRLAASVVLLVAGIAAPLQAWFGWARVERALRRGEPLPSSLLALPIGVAVVVVGLLVLVGILVA